VPQGLSPEAWENYSDGDIQDLNALDIPEAVEAATRRAEAAALTPDRDALEDVLRNTEFVYAEDIVMRDLLDALGLPPTDPET
jgi:hypothetical protein